MKKFALIVCLSVFLGGCFSSAINLVNRLQGDIEHFQNEVSRYSILLKDKDSERVNKYLQRAQELLTDAEKAGIAGDKVAKDQDIQALSDILTILGKYDD